MNRDKTSKNRLISILKVHKSTFSRNRIVSMLFTTVLPEKIKYDKVEFEPCAYSGSDYVCIKNSDAVKLVINLKQCQEQNITLRELHGN